MCEIVDLNERRRAKAGEFHCPASARRAPGMAQGMGTEALPIGVIAERIVAKLKGRTR